MYISNQNLNSYNMCKAYLERLMKTIETDCLYHCNKFNILANWSVHFKYTVIDGWNVKLEVAFKWLNEYISVFRTLLPDLKNIPMYNVKFKFDFKIVT